MIVMLAVVMTGIFALMTTSWIVGACLGLAFAAAFYLLVVVNARRATAKPRRKR
jgi:uncharacterized membrane protein